MARVQLITTGVMEERALGKCLQRCFPDHEFVARPRLDGFTSAKLPPDLASMSPTQRLLLNIHKFARALIGTFAPGGREDRQRPDFVLAVEDLELLNADAPERVTRTVRDSVAHNLENWPLAGPTRARLRAALQERCSFHLMAPMTEAYFFADPAALATATAPALDHPNNFAPSSCDIEAFAVDDPAYLTPLSVPPLRWQTENRRQHPKHYLEYLTDAKLDGGFRYQETSLGARALADLDWAAVLARGSAARFARSLLADLADMLGSDPLGCSHERLALAGCHPLTWPPPRERILRNI